jgi:predicted Fe-Mo cluster-binding NifX family protein
MKIAIPVWEGKVSPVFDTASRLLILQIEDKKETSRIETYFEESDLTRRCLRIQAMGVDILICGAISGHFYRMLVSDDMEVIPWISGTTEDVLDAYLNGSLFDSKFLMPGCHWQKEKGKNSNCVRKRTKTQKVRKSKYYT